MAFLCILVYPDRQIKQVSLPVEEFCEDLKTFVEDLQEILRPFPGFMGIAEPWVNRFERIVPVDFP
jgi:peptide deformylase